MFAYIIVIRWKSDSRYGLMDGRYCYYEEGKARNTDKKEYRKSIDGAKRIIRCTAINS